MPLPCLLLPIYSELLFLIIIKLLKLLNHQEVSSPGLYSSVVWVCMCTSWASCNYPSLSPLGTPAPSQLPNSLPIRAHYHAWAWHWRHSDLLTTHVPFWNATCVICVTSNHLSAFLSWLVLATPTFFKWHVLYCVYFNRDHSFRDDNLEWIKVTLLIIFYLTPLISKQKSPTITLITTPKNIQVTF